MLIRVKGRESLGSQRRGGTERGPVDSESLSIGQQDLLPGENVVCRVSIHRIRLFWPSIGTSFLGLIAVFLFRGAVSSHGSFGGTGILVVGALMFLIFAMTFAATAFVNWQSRALILTDKRLRVPSGAFEKRAASIFLSTIESVVVQQGILGSMLGFGSVILRDHEGVVYCLKKIAQPREFQRHLQELLGHRSEQGR